MSKQLATLFFRLPGPQRKRRKTKYRPSCERMEGRALMCATLLDAPAPVDPAVENTQPAEIVVGDTDFAPNIQIGNNFEASSWGWIELTEGANTDGYEQTTTRRGDYHVVEFNGVQHDGQALNGDYWVTIYVQGRDEPIKKQVTFEDGNATLHTGVSVNNDLKITKVGVSTPPTAAGIANDGISLDDGSFFDPAAVTMVFDTFDGHANTDLPNIPVNGMFEVEMQALKLTGQPLGQAQLNETGDHLVVSNIGSSGQDGVSLDPIESNDLPEQNIQLDPQSVNEAFSDERILDPQRGQVANLAPLAWVGLRQNAHGNGYSLGTTRRGDYYVINLKNVRSDNAPLNGTYMVTTTVTKNGQNQIIRKQVKFVNGSGTVLTGISVDNNVHVRSVGVTIP